MTDADRPSIRAVVVWGQVAGSFLAVFAAIWLMVVWFQ
jgi:hypothetical protein